MTTTTNPTTYRLVAMQASDTPAEAYEALVKALGNELLSVDEGTVEIGGNERAKFVFTIKRGNLRDTVAHGLGYRCGYLVHIES